MDPASDTVDPATQNTAAVVSVEEEEEGVTTPTPAPKIELPPPTLEIHPPEEDLKVDSGQTGGAEETTEVDVDDKKDLPKPDQDQGDAQDGAAAEAETETPIAERPPPPPPKPVDDRDLDSDGETDEPPKASPAESANGSRRESLVHSPAVDTAASSATPDAIPPPLSSRSPPPPPKTHAQRASISGASSVMAPRGNPVSVVLIASSLETIIASKEAKRSPQLKESAAAALEMIRNGQGGDRPREIFEPLRLACDTKNEKLMIASLDCIQKLISYSFFAETVNPALQAEMSSVSPPPSPGTAASTTGAAPMSLADLVTHTITAAYSESIPDSVSLQIVKALLSLVLSNTILVHHSSLLKAVRTVYNVFLLSTDPVNQMVAQGGLTQMVNHVFSRAQVGTPANGTAAAVDSPVTPANGDVVADIHARLAREGVILPKRKNSATPNSSNPATPSSEAMAFRTSTTESVARDSGTNGLSSGTGDSAPTAAETSPTSESADSETKDEAKKPALTIQTTSSTPPRSAGLESNLSIDTLATTSRRGTPAPDSSGQPQQRSTSSAEHSHPHQITTNDLFIKDAFLVFRALCKLTMKPLNNESERDLKSHAMRSKLLSLQLVLQILDNHLPIFVDPTSIIYSSSSDERTPFLHASKQYLCLSLSRNAVSPVNQVFEISVEIFWRVLMGMRTKLKKEIEVLLNEIFLPILEMRTATSRQKSVLLAMLYRLAQDPQALVEIYLNYDCDRDATENIYERLMNIISKMVTTKATESKDAPAKEPVDLSAKNQKLQHGPTFPASPNTAVLGGKNAQDSVATLMPGFTEVKLKRQSLEALVAVLRSLVVWGTGAGGGGLGTGLAGGTVTNGTSLRPTSNGTLDADSRPSSTRISGDEEFASNEAFIDRSNSLRSLRGGASTPDLTDDPGRFETAKQRKTTLLEGIRKFNFKPKRGVKFLIDAGFIKSSDPMDVARFFHETDGLSKAMIGEYLGEGEEDNIATMHAFVDIMDFKELPFVDALRIFLQSFRLPGEAQKIDRFMLKFAERYMDGNPSTVFKNADTAYVLAYSTILLNTDLYNPQVKNRMTKQGFLRNNAGINDGSDLPEELLNSIFDEISNNEIRMKDEVEAAILNAPVPATGLGALALGRDLQKEAYVMQSTGMANKTEALFKTMMRAQKKGSKSSEQFFSASHSVHVRPMFEVAWMSFLAGISGPLQDTDDLEIVELCLDGFKSAIRIVCVFDLELERNAFVTTLAKFTFLNNLGEMKAKNMEAIKALLDIAVTEGNHLKGSWHEVLTCVSQLERMQLISNGIDVPDTGRASGAGRGGPSKMKRLPAEDLANESRSTHITVAADMVFSLSHYLSGTAIVDFVQALSDVSWEEIVSSGTSQHPRMFSLQKLVDISYYNMNRIRLEWSNMWTILGEHFNQVCTHTNPHVAFFALDALRQLAMRFLEKEELAHFKFQKDFLKPFEYTMVHNQNPEVREMILQCLQQMIQLRVHNIRSGWRTMFGVFSAASKSLTERVANMAFEVVTRLNKEHFTEIVRYGAFADLTVCITDFCKVSKYQKISLLAIGMLRGVVPTMINTPETQLGPSETPTGPPAEANGAVPPTDDPMIKFWYPVLLSFYDIIMEGEDLEVRRLALDSLFSTLKTYGATFRPDFWDTVCQELLFRIFAVLRSSQEMSRFSTQEDMSVWLSTTMIQALRNLIDLYTFYFDILERTLDGLLDLLCVCICQENDTLARIGTSCFQQLLENNAKKLSPTRWQAVVKTFVRLFKTTTPHQLFDESLRAEIGENPLPDQEDTPNGKLIPAPLSPSKAPKRQSAGDIIADRRRTFKQIIVKCVLQLLLIETTNELLHNDDVYNTIPPDQLLHLMKVLDHSYQFARSFNADKELRTGLWKVGFMKHLPNLLKQESSSAATLVNVLSRMYYDKRPAYIALHQQIGERLVPLGLGVVEDFNTLRMDTQAKNIAAWTPVIAEVLNGFASFDDHSFSRYLPAIYPLATELLARDLAPEVREAVRRIFVRVGIAKGITMS